MSQDKKVINRILFSRAQIVAFGFALVIFTGTVLLMLPISSKTVEVTNFLDSLFTSTSATWPCCCGYIHSLVAVWSDCNIVSYSDWWTGCRYNYGNAVYVHQKKNEHKYACSYSGEYFLKRHEWCRKNAQKDCCKSIYYRRSRSDSSMYKIYTGDGYS